MQLVSRTREEHTGYGARRSSPVGIGGAIAVHAVVVGTFLLMPKEMIDHILPAPPIDTYAVPIDPPPPPPTKDPVRPKVEIKAPTFDPQPKPYIPPVDINLGNGATVIGGAPFDGGSLTGFGTGEISRPVTPDPILVDAMTDPRYARDFQPGYPPAMQRQEKEGKVTVRVRIGIDGRVIAVDKLFATDDAFWDVTQAQALRKWRFRPATRDGIPIEGLRTMTVHFQLNA